MASTLAVASSVDDVVLLSDGIGVGNLLRLSALGGMDEQRPTPEGRDRRSTLLTYYDSVVA